jgi:copper chaperone CopZ
MTIKLTIDGMHCEKCAAHVQKALEAIGGVKSARVDFGARAAWVETEAGSEPDFATALGDEGYVLLGQE